MKKINTIILFLFLAIKLFPQTDTSITFNEVMFYTSSGDNSEFIELYNISATDTIDLNNFKLKYYTSSADIIISSGYGTLLPPQSYAVIFEGDYDPVIGIYNGKVPSSALILKISDNAFGSSGMANTTSRDITLMNAAGDTLDTYAYSANNSTGISDEKITANKDNSSSNWSNTTQTKGTPGFRNSVTPLSYDLLISSFTASPSINLEDKDINLTVTTKNSGTQSASNYTIEIFNDTNFDSAAEISERIFTQSFTNLAAGDSTTVNTTISNPSKGAIDLITKIIYSIDEDTTNNSKIISLIVFPIQHLFNDIVINEIMYAPSTGKTEWVELFNRTDSSVNLNGWNFSDNNKTVNITSSDIFIPANSFIILSSDSTVLSNYIVPVQLITFSNMPVLNNSGDAVVLHDSLGLLIDSLAYTSDWGGTNGNSLERREPDSNSILQSNWSASTSLKGATPGEINSLTQKDYNIGVTDIIFNPDKPLKGDNVNISTAVNNTGKNSVQYSLELYDITGADIWPGGLVETKLNLTINSGEAKIEFFNTTINNIQNDKLFTVRAVLLIDQDTTDNWKEKIISPGFPTSTIVINEIMFAPVGGEPEWIEIYNSSSDSINLSGWSVTDRFATPVTATISDEIFILPKSYLVITRDSSITLYHKSIPSKIMVLNFPGLNNNQDGVLLSDNRGLTIDSVLYISTWGGTNGFSLERKDITAGSNLEVNWSSSTDNEMSTPGRINSIANRNYDLEANDISFEPRYPVLGDDVIPSLKVINKGQSKASNFSVKFFIDTNSDNVPDQLLSTESGLNLAGFDSINIKSTSEITNLQQKIFIGANIVFAQDEDMLNNYLEASIEPGFAISSILINEVMYAPETGEPEWIELINNSNNPINMKNWSVSDILPSPTKNFITNSDLIINSDEYLILTKDSSFFSIYPNVQSKVKLVNFGSLGNSSDGIIIYDFRDAKIDSLLYSSTWGGNNGFSLERISLTKATNDSTNWTTSLSANHSTPGVSNSIINIAAGTKGQLIINEIMYDHSDGNTEFVEFYNNSNDNIDIGGWKIFDEKGNNFKLSQTSFII